MSMLDPSLLQDFLTESGELIEQLDGDLVRLESADPGEQADLLNACFRALHTIKGAASFLGLDNVINFAHVAEDALNRLRKGEVGVTAEVMDALLKSADVVRQQIEELSAGEEATKAPEDLVTQLKAIVEGSAASAAAAPADDASSSADDTSSAPASEEDLPGTPLSLPPQKADLVEFMVTDLREYTGQIEESVAQLDNDATREDAANALAEIADNLEKTADFFELDDLTRAIKLMVEICPALNNLTGAAIGEASVRLLGIRLLVDEQAHWLEHNRALAWDLDTLAERLQQLGAGEVLPDEATGSHGGDPAQALALDGISLTLNDTSGDAVDAEVAAESTETAEAEAASDAPADSPAAPSTNSAPAAEGNKPAPTENKRSGAPVVDQTIRVEVSRLESLLNLCGQLVLNKNRVLALNRRLQVSEMEHDTKEDFAAAASDLDRLMGELQVGVMRTRMQPLAKLFDRYPRVIRDIARATDKKIDLVIDGKETEVDKSVLENLADPLVHILRNSADHGVELPADRVEKDKPETGVIKLSAEHQGSHVRVAITDDGKGLDREVIGNKAVERGLTTPEQLAQLSDQDVFRFIFEAGFSTAKQVSDLSGRGVGMDVVKTNIQKINGTINIDSAKGKGTTMEILIPLTVAIMPAMVVEIGDHRYCIPLQSVVEIVRPEEQSKHTIQGKDVIRLREEVLPIIDMRYRLKETIHDGGGEFAVVVAVGNQRAGLCVDRLIGQQEIVIKPLDDGFTQGGPFSGATIQEDGAVSLILDVVDLVKLSHQQEEQPAAAA